MIEIGEQTCGGSEFGTRELPKAVERRNVVKRAQSRLTLDRVEIRRRAKLFPGEGRGRGATLVVRSRLRRGTHQKLGRRIARELGVDRDRLDHLERACRDVGRGQSANIADAHHGAQPVARARVEKHVLGQRPCRHHANDRALYQGLTPSRLRDGWTFDLLGDGDAVSGLDQPREIGVGGMHRHPAHRHAFPVMLAARGQRDVERGGSSTGIVEEQFEEVAHAVEQQAIGRFGLQRMILRHHRGRYGHRRFYQAVVMPVQGWLGTATLLG